MASGFCSTDALAEADGSTDSEGLSLGADTLGLIDGEPLGSGADMLGCDALGSPDSLGEPLGDILGALPLGCGGGTLALGLGGKGIGVLELV